MAVNTPAERIPSHGTDFFGQRFAFDLVRPNEGRTGFSTRPLWQQFFFHVPAADFLAWNEPVYSATVGEVIAAEDGWPDRLRVNALWELVRAHLLQKRPPPGDLRPLLGNHLFVQSQEGVAVYAHLRKGGLCVSTGDRVARGQRLAAVGNSGNSTMPHLHFHLMDRADPWNANGILCGFPATSAIDGELSHRPFVPDLMQPFKAVQPCCED